MIILSDSNNNVVGSFIDGTTVANLAGVTTLPAQPEQQVGVNATLKIDPATNALSYKYEAIGVSDGGLKSGEAANYFPVACLFDCAVSSETARCKQYYGIFSSLYFRGAALLF